MRRKTVKNSSWVIPSVGAAALRLREPFSDIGRFWVGFLARNGLAFVFVTMASFRASSSQDVDRDI